MRSFTHRIWRWLSALLTTRGGWRGIAHAMKDRACDLIDTITGNKYKGQGKLIWDSGRHGTYRRQAPKIGRNAPCPCGKMRTGDRDVTKVNKYKYCCGVV